jgi:hypothetical protein
MKLFHIIFKGRKETRETRELQELAVHQGVPESSACSYCLALIINEPNKFIDPALCLLREKNRKHNAF